MRNAKGQFLKGIESHNKKWFGKCIINDCLREDLKAFGLCQKHHKRLLWRRKRGQDISIDALGKRLPRTAEHILNNTVCRVGKTNSLKGKKYTDIYGDRAEDILKKHSESLLGKGLGRISTRRGIPLNKEIKQKISKALKGLHSLDKNPAWKGGKSFEKYGQEFNKELKLKIRTRDCFKCVECGVPELELNYALSVHHIDENKRNNLDLNLISLCKKCHAKVHFTTGDWKNYLTEILNGETL